MARMTAPKKYVGVAAIDFGTTFSGYAFSFVGNEEDIRLNKDWGIDLGYQVWLKLERPQCTFVVSEKAYPIGHYDVYTYEFQSLKAPTCVLVNKKDNTFKSFGFEAENDYLNALSEDGGNDLLLFRHFKMSLHQKPVRP